MVLKLSFMKRKERHYKLTVIDDDDGFTNKKDVRKFFKSSSGTRFIPSYESFFYSKTFGYLCVFNYF